MTPWNRLAAIVVIILASFSARLQAQVIDEEIAAWQISSYRSDVDLNDRTVQFFDFAVDGSIWFAISNGLYQYDGYRWNRYTALDGLPSNYVRSVHCMPDGGIWVGTDKGAAYFDGERFDCELTSGQLAGPSVRRIVGDPDGSIWFCCDQWPVVGVRSGLTRLQNGNFTTWRSEDGLPSDYVSDYFRDSQGRQFVLTDRGLAQFANDGFALPWKDAGFDDVDNYVWSMVESSRYGLLAATRTHFFQFQDGKWSRWKNENLQLSQTKLAVTIDGEIFTCSPSFDSRFYRWNGNKFAPIGKSLNSFSGGVQFVAEDPSGDVWVGGFERLMRWDRGNCRWQRYSDLGIPLLRDQAGAVWFENSPRGGLLRLKDGAWQEFSDLSSPIIDDGEGRVWMSATDGIACWDLNQIRRFHDPQFADAKVIGKDVAGTIWVSGHDPQSGKPVVATVTKDKFSVINSFPADADTRIDEACIDPENGIWAIVSKNRMPPFQLFHVEADVTSSFPMPTWTQLKNPPAIFADRDRIWLYGFHGVCSTPTDGPGDWSDHEIAGKPVYNFVAFKDRVIAARSGELGGESGLISFADGSWKLLSDAGGRIVGTDGNSVFLASRNRCWKFDLETNLVTPPFILPIDVNATALVPGSSGSLWIRIGGETFHYQPDAEDPETDIVRYAESLTTGEKLSIAARGVKRMEARQSVHEYFCSYRVDDGPWAPYQSAGNDIDIADLPVGEHVLEIRVKDSEGRVDPTPSKLAVQVRPVPLQDRAWFQPAALALLMALVGLAFTSTMGWLGVRRLANGLEQEVFRQTRAVRANESKYRMLFEDSADPICWFGLDGELRDFNPAAATLLGCNAKNRLSLADIFVDAEDERHVQECLRRQGSLRNNLVRIQGRDGSIHKVLLSANHRTDEIEGIQVVLRDVTKMAQLEERLQSKQKMEAVGRMAGGISHDFNNFLAVIVNATEYVDVMQSDPSHVQHGVEMILEAADRAKKLSQQIQSFSRSPMKLTRIIDTRTVLVETLRLIRNTIDESIVLSMQLPENLGRIKANREQFEQVVLNLTINACQAMPEGGRLTIQAQNVDIDGDDATELNLDRGGRFVSIEFHDTGVGISDENRKKIFDPFFTTKGPGNGTGLGLSIVNGIIQNFGGCIQVESLVGAGSCFRIYIPFRSEPEDVESTDEPLIHLRRGDELLLLVEDESVLRELTRSSLERQGYSVMTANNGLVAKQILQDKRNLVDLVISDVVMPELSGIELVNWIQESRPDVPVLLVSGYPQPDLEIVNQEDLETPFIRKPFGTAELIHRVRQLLDNAVTS